MIRSTSDGIHIWFQLTCDPSKKMVWSFDTFLQATNGQSSSMETFKTRLVHLGKIEKMTEQDYEELNQNPPKSRRAAAVVELASTEEVRAIAATVRSER